MTTRLVITVVVLLSSTITVLNQSKPAPTVQGVWRIVEATTTGPTGSTNSKPQPSLYIFTAGHYSILRVGSANARPSLPADVNKATAAELNAVWGNPAFAANAGTYDVSGSTLTTRALVAKNPYVMASGSFTAYSYKLDGKNLSLTNIRTNGGPVENATTLRLTRLE